MHQAQLRDVILCILLYATYAFHNAPSPRLSTLEKRAALVDISSKLQRLGPLVPRNQDRSSVTELRVGLDTSLLNAAATTSGNPLSGIYNNLSSLLILALIVAVHELGHFIGARAQGIRVKNFSIGFGPRLLTFKGRGAEDPDDDVEYTIRAIPAGGFVSFPQHYEIDKDGDIIRYEDKNLLQNRPPLQQAIVISAGVIANALLSFTLLFGSVATSGLPRPSFSEGPYVMRLVDKDAPAAKAGIQPEDLILAVDGQKVTGDEAGLSGAVSLISQSESGPVDITLRRKGEEIVKRIEPRRGVDGRRSIGVQMAAHIEKVELIRAKNPGEALKYASEEFSQMLRESTSAIRRFTNGGSMEGLTGPLGIVKTGANLAAIDQLALVKFAAFISVNLAVVNALPFPGLDGGQMVFVLIEAIRGKRLDPKVENGINAVAILLLASLSFYLIAGDLTRAAPPIEQILDANPTLDNGGPR